MKERSKTRIVFDANPLVQSKSGVGYFTHGLIQALADSAPDSVQLVGFYANFFGRKRAHNLPVAPNISYIETKYFPTKILNGLRRIGVQIPLEFFVRQKADVALFPNFITMPTLSKPLRVVVVHDLSFVDHPEYVSARNGSFLRKWVPRYIKHSDVVITISGFTKKRIIEEYGVPPDKIFIVPIPPHEHSQQNDAILDKFNLRKGYILFVGNIEPRKNIVGLLDAFEKLPSNTANAYPLVLAGGKGWNDDQILTRLDDLKQKGLPVISTGYVTEEEKSALFANATVFVQPSHYEGFGMPILEAMSYGRPVACSNIEVFHEVADNAAVFFEPNDPQNISDTLSKLLRDPQTRKTMSRASQSRIRDYKSWQDVAVDFLDIINQSLPKQSSK